MNNMSIYPIKNKNKNMKDILIKVALVIGVAVSLYLSAMVATSQHYWCFKDKDTCTIEEIEYWRGLKEKTNSEITARYNEQMATSNDYFDNKKINPLKLTLSASALIKEAKEGDKRNLPQELFSLKNSLVPIAHADENRGDGWIKDVEIKDQEPISTAQGNEKTLRYQALLTSVGSPYANVDIESHCANANLNQVQCDLLVGIAQAESQSGTDYKCDYKSKEAAITLGQSAYHNPVGIKDFRDDGIKKNPDANGCYLWQFPSWDAFWEWFPQKMIKSYAWDRQMADVSYMSGCWVKGKDKKGNCLPPAKSWEYRVESFIKRI